MNRSLNGYRFADGAVIPAAPYFIAASHAVSPKEILFDKACYGYTGWGGNQQARVSETGWLKLFGTDHQSASGRKDTDPLYKRNS